MKNRKPLFLLSTLIFAATFAAEIAAQGSVNQASAGANLKGGAGDGATRNMPDMRLWSFGDCANKFPYVNSDEHKDCVRVVGSDEARDARAFRVCETSNPGDSAEVARCKNTYKSNRDRSAQSGYVPNMVPQQQAVPSAEELHRVRTIASLAVENDKATATRGVAAAAPEEAVHHAAPPSEEPGGPSPLMVVLGLVAAGGGAAAFVARRKQGGAIPVR